MFRNKMLNIYGNLLYVHRLCLLSKYRVRDCTVNRMRTKFTTTANIAINVAISSEKLKLLSIEDPETYFFSS